MSQSKLNLPNGVQITGSLKDGYTTVLTREALEFVADLARTFGGRVEELLARRAERQARLDAGTEKLDFFPETASIRNSDWTVAPLPSDILDRRVEITGPVDRKMIINALNSGANVFMADFEDSNCPTWENNLDGHINLRDAVERSIHYTAPDTGKTYALNDKTAVLFVRPRGWHLVEKHMLVDSRPVPGGLFDFGLYFFHNAKSLLAKGSGPYFYLPKMQSHLEARLWNDVFVRAQKELGIPNGTIKATVLIETLPGAFEMDEILYELRDHSAGLNCGRWDYIFSYIKTFRNHPQYVIPDRGQVTMEQPFMRAYTQLLVKTCHRRNVHAMGGMAAQIPIKNDPAANETALAKVRADKLREVKDGHDGTWVAHPGLVPLALEIFDAHMPTANQIHRKREDVRVTAADLTAVPQGARTEGALRNNIKVGIQYIESWLRGTGCVPLYNLMEDAATAEIARTQVWQWLRHKATLDNGKTLSADYFKAVAEQEMEAIKTEIGAERFAGGQFLKARELFERLALAESYTEFLTLPAYEYVLQNESR
ncbi:MAG: malate synthase A [Myxococcales bacterium]|nr:MAG: malate synthase A [Myxococcales bacterium]